jgi:hypothetical protein
MSALGLVSRVSFILSDRADFGGEKGEGYLPSEPIVAEGGSERRAGEAEGRDNVLPKTALAFDRS